MNPEVIHSLMLRYCKDDAWWTADIARQARASVADTRKWLVKLEKAGFVERVMRGNPTSWRIKRTASGTALLGDAG